MEEATSGPLSRLGDMGAWGEVRAPTPRTPNLPPAGLKLKCWENPREGNLPPPPDLKAARLLLQEALPATPAHIVRKSTLLFLVVTELWEGCEESGWPCFGPACAAGFGQSRSLAGPGIVCCDIRRERRELSAGWALRWSQHQVPRAQDTGALSLGLLCRRLPRSQTWPVGDISPQTPGKDPGPHEVTRGGSLGAHAHPPSGTPLGSTLALRKLLQTQVQPWARAQAEQDAARPWLSAWIPEAQGPFAGKLSGLEMSSPEFTISGPRISLQPPWTQVLVEIRVQLPVCAAPRPAIHGLRAAAQEPSAETLV